MKSGQRRCHWALIALAALLITVKISSAPTASVAATGHYVALSLGQAEQLLANNGSATPELENLTGITRIVGMVFDEENRDVILVGHVVDGLPPSRLDDLVIALRAQLLHAEWPLVSIDPTPETPKNRLLTIQSRGGIENTHFGQVLIESDIFLKKYSFGLERIVPGISPFSKEYERLVGEESHQTGIGISGADWRFAHGSADCSAGNVARSVRKKENCHNRFWFFPVNSSRFDEVEGVLIVRDLCLGVSRESIRLDSAATGIADSSLCTRAATGFAEQFTDGFDSLASAKMILRELQNLYAMVAVAEGIGRLTGRPALQYLIHDYRISTETTPKEIQLIELCGEFHRSDSSDYVVDVTGGIMLMSRLTDLNAGVASALRDIVLDSRPQHSALRWSLPLQAWLLSNDAYCGNEYVTGRLLDSLSAMLARDTIGFSISTEAFVLEPLGVTNGTGEKFSGFGSYSYSSSPLPRPVSPLIASSGIGGVEISPQPVGNEKSLKDLKTRLLRSRSHKDSLSWPVKKPEKE